MKKLAIILFIEVQIVLGFLVYQNNQLQQLDQKVFNTNKMLFQENRKKQIEELSHSKVDDIKIGSDSAMNKVFLYTKMDCPYCEAFFTETYPAFKEEFIDTKKAQLVIRFMHSLQSEHQEKVKALYSASQKNQVLSVEQITGKSGVTAVATENFDAFQKSIYTSALKAGIKSSPTFIIDGEIYKGSRKMTLFRSLLSDS